MAILIESLETGFDTTLRAAAKVLPQAPEEPPAAPGQRLFLAPWQERKAKAILERSLYTRLFIADVARQCALSRSHFSRAFKKTTGMSPQEWCLDLRVRQAKKFLATGFMPLSQISLECGFADQSHFSRMFSRIVGATPKRWQRLNVSLSPPTTP
jgi:AraC family transcriptional regulator